MLCAVAAEERDASLDFDAGESADAGARDAEERDADDAGSVDEVGGDDESS